ncbi:MAG TPA: DEAD/DEAH box helicase, partial [Usitatibacter sp.]|nr:DEAD/DEAH box helicase [Usitatibacter sp.]
MKREELPAAHEAVACLEEWFAANGWHAFDFQREVWRAYLAGESGLVHSATGSGKTLAAWLGALAEWMGEQELDPGLRRDDVTPAKAGAQSPPIRVLWITPMRALAGDTRLSLERAVQGLGVPWTVGLRTGDTSSAERAKQARRLPSALVTTPESLSLMLSQADAREKLSDLRCVVVDEWHELLGNKRGVMTELALARLRKWNPQLRTWGLSATLGNVDEAAQRLVPNQHVRIVKGVSDKQIVMDTLIPPEVDKFPWAGHLGLAMLEHVIEAIDGARSTLVFTNVRSQAEIWYQGLLEARPEWAGLIGLHHGSLDAEVRQWVEAGLKEGRLKAVVATSSLDLGVDFSPVDRVLQIGSPKGVARLLQRAGRSGHAPGEVSRVTCVPSHALEFVEAAAARRAAQAGRIEARQPVDRPLDLLTQHLVTIAVGEGFEEQDMKAEVRATRAFRDLTDAEWQWALDFVTRGGDALKAYPEYHKVERGEDGVYRVRDAAIAKRHRMSIGTIVSDAAVNIQYRGGKRLGNVEESFIARLSHGDNFIFAGLQLEFIRVENMTAYVKPGKPGSTLIPRW